MESIVILMFVLVVARFVKRGSATLKRFFIPSSLIGGFAALLLGPQVFGLIGQPIANEWALYPKLLINIVFAGLFLGVITPSPREIWDKSAPMLAFGNTLAWGQYVIGILLGIFVLTPLFNAPPMAGALIEIGFEGGHGTAAGLAPTFEKLGWSAGTDVALGLATVSIVVAIFSGLLIINIHNRMRGRVLDEAGMKSQQQRMVRSGYSLTKFANKLETNPAEITWTIILFAVSIGIGYLLKLSLIFVENSISDLFGSNLQFFVHLPLFPLAMIGGLIVQLFLRWINRTHIVKRNTIKVFSAVALDLLILSAIATLSLRAIGDNFGIFITLAVAGIAWILFSFFFFAPRFFRRYWFENGITNTGQSMGMTATGLLMNRLADPTNHTGAREGFAYKQLAFEPFMGGGIVTAGAAVALAEFGPYPMLAITTVCFLFWMILGFHLGHTPRRARRRHRQERSIGRAALK